MMLSRALRLSLVLFALLLAPLSLATAQTAGDTAIATDQVYVRSQPSTESPILAELYPGEEVMLHGESSNGFLSIIRGDYVGWVSSEYLEIQPGSTVPSAPVADPTLPEPTSTPNTPEPTAEPSVPDPTLPQPTSTPVETPAPVAPTPVPTEAPSDPQPDTSGSIIWPVAGGEWEILQGYNGSSHQNNSSNWQYQESLDLVRTDGSTAGQTVYAPATGIVRWFDPATGGISIDMGNGYAVALFHVIYDGSIQVGDTVVQGQAIGTAAPVGTAAAWDVSHVHIAVWATNDGGNWSRESVPFSGSLSISGYDLPNNGSSYQHTGIVFYP